MTPPSPLQDADGVVRLEITADGKALDETAEVISVETWNSVNKIPRARVVLSDGDMPNGTFPISDSAALLPGAAVSIAVGYGDKKDTIFEGIVIKHGIVISGSNESRLVVDLADKAIKMTVSRQSAVFEQKTDSDLMSSLITSSGLRADVTSTTASHEAVVQFAASDWDTLLYRADINGLLVVTSAGSVSVKAPETSQNAVLRVTYGDSLISLRTDMDAVSQLAQSAIKSMAWDIKTQALLSATAGAVNVKQVGNVSSATLAAVCSADEYAQLTGGYVTNEDLQAWSTARLLRAQLAKIRGRVEFQGSALVTPGTVITLEGVGDRFSGDVFVSSVRHDVGDGNWTTAVDFGLAADWFSQQESAAVASASGHLPPVKGLQTGVVRQIDEDPAGEFRVLVTLPLLQDAGGVWARLSSSYASSSVGTVFYPEIGDEVVIAFMNEDPRFPVILGSLYSSKLAPPKPPDKENKTKGFVTRSKMELTFDETDKVIVLKTPGNHVITITDKAKAITIVDSQNNSVTLNDSGVSIESKSNLTLKATGNISIEATGNLSMKATSNATLEGLQIDLKAQTAVSAHGIASAELKSSGIVTVQGGLVKIN